MSLQFYVNFVLAAVGTGWGLVWLVHVLVGIKRDIAWSYESRIREVVDQMRPQTDNVAPELRALEAYLGIRYDYNKELKRYWFEPLPKQPTYRRLP